MQRLWCNWSSACSFLGCIKNRKSLDYTVKAAILMFITKHYGYLCIHLCPELLVHETKDGGCADKKRKSRGARFSGECRCFSTKKVFCLHGWSQFSKLCSSALRAFPHCWAEELSSHPWTGRKSYDRSMKLAIPISNLLSCFYCLCFTLIHHFQLSGRCYIPWNCPCLVLK